MAAYTNGRAHTPFYAAKTIPIQYENNFLFAWQGKRASKTQKQTRLKTPPQEVGEITLSVCPPLPYRRTAGPRHAKDPAH